MAKGFDRTTVQWIEVGQPDDRRLAKACAKAEIVRIWAFSSATRIWWSGIENKVNLSQECCTPKRGRSPWRVSP